MFPIVGFTWLYKSEELDKLADVYTSIGIVKTVWRLWLIRLWQIENFPKSYLMISTNICFTNSYFYYGTPGHLLL